MLARGVRVLAALAAISGLSACGLIVGLGNYDEATREGGVTDARSEGQADAQADVNADSKADVDATVSDTGSQDSTIPNDAVDASADSKVPADSMVQDSTSGLSEAEAGPSDAATDVGSLGYHDISNASFWEAVDLAPLAVDAGLDGGALSGGFFGAAFDGRFLYLPPANGTVVAQFDTQSGLGLGGGWAFADLSVLFGPGTFDYQGAVYDGTYVYFAPSASTVSMSAIVRFNTKGAGFTNRASWDDSSATFQICTSSCGAFFSGVVLAPPAIYFLPSDRSPDGFVFRYLYDAGGFDQGDSGAWSVFTLGAIGSPPPGIQGGAFDGRFVDMAPGPVIFEDEPPRNELVRYDTTPPSGFGDAATWSSESLTEPDASADASPDASFPAFNGVVYDGRYLYTTSAGLGPGGAVLVAQIPAGADAGPPAFVNAQDRFPPATSLLGGVFDGRYVYFVPGGDPAASIALRYDTTQGAFAGDGGTVFESFDTSTLAPPAAGFAGGAFDGQFVYFIPNAGSVIARFQATASPRLPSTISGGSFY